MSGEDAPSTGWSLEGATLRFRARSLTAERIWLCLFDDQDRETARIELSREADGWFGALVPEARDGTRYGLRADGRWAPEDGFWFDPAKLLVDPYAMEIDRPYRHDARLGLPREAGVDTAPLMPKTILRRLAEVPVEPPRFKPGGFIYEASPRALTMRHPQVAPQDRGTLRALARPAIIEHLAALGVDAVELMPVTAWMDERHLPPLGLSNAWGYNPVTFMALDPRLAPGGWADLHAAVKALHAAGIGVILDLVFNHTAESDALGTTLSLRGLDARTAFRHGPDGTLINDTGCGNTLACERAPMRDLIMESLRRFVRHAGVDGFRFDLAPILGRGENGFDAHAALLAEMRADPIVGGRILIAEPWDIGPGGYQLGRFGAPFLEWNDRYRDDVRRFWRGDHGMIGALATRLAGSSDVFGGGEIRSVNFLAAHDGKTLRDLVTYRHKHNEANGEQNRDGHDDDIAWNHGVEGPSDDRSVNAARRDDLKALLATLFVSRGAVMLTAGDEFGRTQSGNNNAYAQDNALTWLDWAGRDLELQQFTASLAALRREFPQLTATRYLGEHDVRWLREDGHDMTVADWEDAARRSLTMVLVGQGAPDLGVIVNGASHDIHASLPAGGSWRLEVASQSTTMTEDGRHLVAARSVAIYVREDDAKKETS